jgi:hypothetical protein
MSPKLRQGDAERIVFVTYLRLPIGIKYAIIGMMKEVNVKLKNLIFFLLVSGALFSITACKKADTIFPDDAEGTLSNYTGCKNTGVKQSPPGNRMAQNIQECIEYRYNGENTLLIYHSNAVFNCCPGTILADTNFSQELIAIVERESEHGCKCNCHYDLDYHFNNIPPGVYLIRITCEGGEIREYTVDLNASYSGSKCWDSPLQNE